jgi:hypothetical protein
MTSNFGDATIVGDPLKQSGEYTFNGDSLGKGPSSSGGKAGPQRPLNDFTTTDYGLQERPFFVPIANGGILAALQKLDHQLLNVGPNPVLFLWLSLTKCLVWKNRAFL